MSQQGFPQKQGSDASFVHVDHPSDSCPEFDYEEVEKEPDAVVAAGDDVLDEQAASSREEVHEGTGGPADTSTSGSRSEAEYDQVQEDKVARDIAEVQHAAYEYTLKMAAGLKSAIGGLGKADSPGLSKLAGGLASWWAPPEPRSQSQQVEAQGSQSKGQATAELQELLGLLPDENLVESFKCKLLQTYSCSHNCFTPAIQMAFQGTLYITDQHCCFLVEERNSKLPFRVLHQEIKRAVRQRQQRKGDLSDILHLSQDSSGQQFLAFKDFETSSALDNALALVQHLMGQ